MNWQSIDIAPKDRPILVCDHEEHSLPPPVDEVYITSWIEDVYTYQGGKGGPSGWFSGRYYDNWGDQPEMDRPKHWKEIDI